jgi:hypothetical protein
MNTNSRLSFVNALSSLALALPMLIGCGSPDVHPSITLIDRTTHPLNVGAFLEVMGSYGSGCTNRSGSWSVGIGGYTGLSNAPLSVVRNDTGCALTATSLRLGTLGANSLYFPPAGFSLGGSYAGSASAFAMNVGDPVAFYGNFQVLPDLSFANDFNIDLLYSEDPNLASASAVANYAVQSATASSGAVAAPDYALDMTGFTMQVDVNKIVQSTGGNAALTLMNTAAQTYVLSTNDLGATPTYAQVDAEFQAGSAQALSGMNPMLTAATFALSGANLSSPRIRTLLLANTQSGTPSYEAFRIAFSAP